MYFLLSHLCLVNRVHWHGFHLPCLLILSITFINHLYLPHINILYLTMSKNLHSYKQKTLKIHMKNKNKKRKNGNKYLWNLITWSITNIIWQWYINIQRIEYFCHSYCIKIPCSIYFSENEENIPVPSILYREIFFY